MLKIKDMNLNNVIRQGDSQRREYQLDTGNLNLNLTNKSATIRLMTADFQGIGYETTATVSGENKISFSIDDVIPARQYRLEVTVDDYVFPSRATDGRFDIDPSSHGQEVKIIQVIGKDEIVRDVKEQVEDGLQPFLGEISQSELDRQAQEEARVGAESTRETNEQDRLNKDSLRDDKVAQMEADKDAVIANATVDSEVILARGGKATLGQRLDETTAQLAQTTPEIYVDTLPRLAPEVVDNFRIQRAIDSLEGTGGTVKLGAGEYVVNDTIQMGFGITLEGLNQYATKIKTNVDKVVFNIGQPNNFIFYTAIKKLHIEGNSTGLNQTAIHYTGRNPAYSIIDEVMITEMGGYGIRGGHDGHVNNVEVTRCFIENCGIDGIDFSYGEGQINAIWIHRNNVVACKTGIRFFGNNVVVESNTVQANEVAFSVGDSELLPLGVGIGFYCMGSVIEKNYTEKNGKSIEIFHSYTETHPTTKSRVIRQLEIKNNFLAETGVDALIEVFDISNSQPQHGNGSVIVKNNFGEKPIIKLNKPTALSHGSVIDESRKELTPTSLLDFLPDWVEVRGYVNKQFKVSKTNVSLQSGWTPYNQGSYISKDKNGLVELHFSATAGTINLGTTVAVLPQGLRPKNNIMLDLYSPTTGAYQGKGLVVRPNGEIKALFGDEILTSGHVYSGMLYYKA